MSFEWKELTLNDLAYPEGGLVDGPFGSNLKASSYTETGIPIIRGSNLSVGLDRFKSEEFAFVGNDTLQRLKRSECVAGDIIFTKKGTLGQTGLVPKDGVYESYLLSSNQMRLRVNKKIANPEYVYYWVSSHQSIAKIKQDSEFTGVPKINLDYLRKFPVRLPSLSIQKKIVCVLASLDYKIQLNRQTNQTLEHIAQALFKSWFVDFEPTRAKIAAKQVGQDPERAAMAAISGKTVAELDQLDAAQLARLKTTAALFPDGLVESELGEVPEGWVVEDISSFANILNGFAFKRKDYVEKGTFVLRTKNFNDNVVRQLMDDVFLPDQFLQTHEKYLSQEFDYHLVMVGASIGNRGLIYPHHLPALRNQNMWCFRKKDDTFVSQCFIKFMLDKAVETSSGLTTGSAREFFRKGDFGGQSVCIGSRVIQAAFSDLVFPLMQKQAILDNENKALSETRDTLLPKLLSGELSPTQAEVA